MSNVIGGNVKTILHQESAQAHTVHMSRIKNNKAASNNLVRLAAAKHFDEPSATKAASVSRILKAATP